MEEKKRVFNTLSILCPFFKTNCKLKVKGDIMNSKETDSKETDSKETDSKETDSKETDNKGYMRCEYFFSLNPKSPPKCKYCIYSDRDFCPADLERYKPFCDE